MSRTFLELGIALLVILGGAAVSITWGPAIARYIDDWYRAAKDAGSEIESDHKKKGE